MARDSLVAGLPKRETETDRRCGPDQAGDKQRICRETARVLGNPRRQRLTVLWRHAWGGDLRY
ncbi:hypothetical protein [Mycetohabitans sp. B46]|uniref:hypothetical protein n=1 Tax=Mycetohabitans sp. B46 TaxID=2772536 RepID=UPI00307EC8A8